MKGYSDTQVNSMFLDRWEREHGHGYFDDDGLDHDECPLCGKEKWKWEGGTDEKYCPQCKRHILEGFSDIMAGTRAWDMEMMWNAMEYYYDREVSKW